MSRYGRFTHRCSVCGKGFCSSANTPCHKAHAIPVLTLNERRNCEHNLVPVSGVPRWPKMCTLCGAMSK